MRRSSTIALVLLLLQVYGGSGDLLAGDCNGNGVPDSTTDLAVGFSRSSGIAILRNEGGARFAAPERISLGGDDTFHVAAGDFDEDGKVDLAVCREWGLEQLTILRNAGGHLEPGPAFVTRGAPNAIAAADLDADGDLDLALGSRRKRMVMVFLNDGRGVLSSSSVVDVASEVVSIVPLDADGDGDLDLAAGHEGESRAVSLLANGGSGRFAEAARYAGPGGSVRLAAGDLDGDDHPDIALVGGEPFVSILPGDRALRRLALWLWNGPHGGSPRVRVLSLV